MPVKKKSVSTKPKAKPAPAKAEHVHGPDCDHGHSHGDDNLSCEVAIRVYRPEDFKELTKVWKSGQISLDDTDSMKKTTFHQFDDRRRL